MEWILVFLATLLMVMVLITIHEYGHFLCARWFKIKIIQFSIGFGRPLWRRPLKDGGELAIGRYLVGGYVKLLDTREEEVASAERRFAFDLKPIWQRTILLLAGSFANLLLAFVLFMIMFSFGVIQFKPVIGSVIADSIADQAGLHSGQQIIAIDNKLIFGWQAALLATFRRIGDHTTMTMLVREPKSRIQSIKVLSLKHWQVTPLDPSPIQSLGINPYIPSIPARIATAQNNESQLQKGDVILSVNQQKITDWDALEKKLNSLTPLHDAQFEILRENQKINLNITLPKISWYAFHYEPLKEWGVQGPPRQWQEKDLLIVKFPWYQTPYAAMQQIWDFADFNLMMITKLLQGKLSLLSLGGPLSVFEGAYYALGQGVLVFLGFCALVSISLAVVNLLPWPGLDGGQLLLLLIEKFRGKPLSLRVQLLIYRLGVIALIVFMLQVTANDLHRIAHALA